MWLLVLRLILLIEPTKIYLSFRHLIILMTINQIPWLRDMDLTQFLDRFLLLRDRDDCSLNLNLIFIFRNRLLFWHTLLMLFLWDFHLSVSVNLVKLIILIYLLILVSNFLLNILFDPLPFHVLFVIMVQVLVKDSEVSLHVGKVCYGHVIFVLVVIIIIINELSTLRVVFH